MSAHARSPADGESLAWSVAEHLATKIGPRRPCGAAELAAAEHVAARLEALGASVEREGFEGIASFAGPQALAPALALLGRPGRRGGRALGALAVLCALAEGDPRRQPLTRLMARRQSRNVVARVEPSGAIERTLCVVSHLDTSRSGLLFDPGLAPHLRTTISAFSGALLVRAAVLLAGGLGRVGRLLSAVSAPLLAGGLALLAERELRGADVPGANDNASGVGVSVALAAGLATEPLERTRLVILATGCEESGTVGMRSFLEAHDTGGWLFLNLDGVGAPATLRYLPREGVGRTWPADAGLVALAEGLAQRRPELGLKAADRLVGLTYDATQVLARGGRALTLSAQDDAIPNYHRESDVAQNLDRDVLRRALEVVRELARAVDSGAAD